MMERREVEEMVGEAGTNAVVETAMIDAMKSFIMMVGKLLVDQSSEVLCELGSTMNFMTKEEQWIIQLCSIVYLCHHFGVTLMFLACSNAMLQMLHHDGDVPRRSPPKRG